MARIRWGILGTGRMAATLAAELKSMDARGVELAAVAGSSPDKARQFALQYKIPRALDNAEQLAADALDAIYIATPHTLHHSHMLTCLKANKAVLCEKPFTLNAIEAEEIQKAATDRRIFSMEAMWTRFLPALVALRRLLAEGRIGEVRMITGGGAFIPTLPQGHYLLDRARGGGVLLDAGVYLVSLASMILGAPRKVLASGHIGLADVDEQNAILLSYPNGAQALLYVSLQARRSPDLEILGDRGRIRLAAPVFRPSSLTIWSADGSESIEEYPIEGTGYGYQIDAVCSALRTGQIECASMPLSESIAIMHTLDQVRAQTGMRYPGETH